MIRYPTGKLLLEPVYDIFMNKHMLALLFVHSFQVEV